MNRPSYPLASSSWDPAEYAALREVIDSGRFTMGERVAAFEQAFARWMGARYCVMSNSGSSANLLMIAALRFRKEAPLMPGDEVIVPAVSWSTTYAPLQQYGLHLKFVDIDPHTLNLDLQQLEAALSPRTRAVLAVNLLGNPCDFGRLQAMLAGRNVLLLEDNCESMGATLDGRQAGTFGLMGSYSTFFSHHICTMEGGMTVTDDEELYHIMLSLRAHGWTRNLPRHNQVCEKSDDPFEESFRFVLPGYNLRPLEMSGALGLTQLDKLPALIAQRRANAARFLDIVAEFPYLRPQRETGCSSWFGFSMVLEADAPYDRAQLLRVMDESGIETRPIVAGNFAKNPVLRWFDHSIHGRLSAADEVDRRGFFVGNHGHELGAELQSLHDALRRAHAGAAGQKGRTS